VRREKLRRGRRPEGAPRGRPEGAPRGRPHAPLDEPATPEEFRARQLRARDLLRGDLEGRELERHVEEAVVTTRFERALGWARANSVFPLTFGLACCAIEMISLVTPRYDIARFGAENMRASPRQADLLILSGRVSIKMAPVVRRIYDQMLEPKWAIAMGACSSSGGMFANYAVVQGADKFMPVDVHVPGCPPRPEALISGFNKLQRKIQGYPDPGWRQRYNAIGTEEWARTGATEPTQEERDAYTAARELTREMSAPGGDGA
jgi:NADH-quinone oxidoreductase subunit B